MSPQLSFLVLTVAGWMRRRERAAIEYVMAENRVLREQLGALVRGSDFGPGSLT